jgi:hypothetical protein
MNGTHGPRGGGRSRAADVTRSLRAVMPTYFLQDAGGYLGLLEHPAPNLAVGDDVVLADGRRARVTARIDSWRGSRFAAVLDIVIVSPGQDGRRSSQAPDG